MVMISCCCQCAQYPCIVHFKMAHLMLCKSDLKIKTSEAESAPNCVGGFVGALGVRRTGPGPGPGFLTRQPSRFSRLTSHAGPSPAPSRLGVPDSGLRASGWHPRGPPRLALFSILAVERHGAWQGL